MNLKVKEGKLYKVSPSAIWVHGSLIKKDTIVFVTEIEHNVYSQYPKLDRLSIFCFPKHAASPIIFQLGSEWFSKYFIEARKEEKT